MAHDWLSIYYFESDRFDFVDQLGLRIITRHKIFPTMQVLGAVANLPQLKAVSCQNQNAIWLYATISFLQSTPSVAKMFKHADGINLY